MPSLPRNLQPHPLDPTAKKLWLEALRSGEFPQAQGVLRNAIGYCCLGVACEVFRQTTGRGEWQSRNSGPLVSTMKFVVGSETSVTSLPKNVSKWLCPRAPDLGDWDRCVTIPSPSPGIIGHTPITSCVALNDTHHMSFHEIADHIEKHL